MLRYAGGEGEDCRDIVVVVVVLEVGERFAEGFAEDHLHDFREEGRMVDERVD